MKPFAHAMTTHSGGGFSRLRPGFCLPLTPPGGVRVSGTKYGGAIELPFFFLLFLAEGEHCVEAVAKIRLVDRYLK